jgi:hypothetical protein
MAKNIFVKNNFPSAMLVTICMVVFGCGNPPGKEKGEIKDSSYEFSAQVKQLLQGNTYNPFSVSVIPEKINFYLPAVQSFARATFNGNLIIIGGEVVGYHGTANNPRPFLSSVANDSMFVIDLVNGKSYGVPVPAQYWNALSVTNPQSFQVNRSLFLCGGYTLSDSSQKRFNTTSNSFFQVDIPAFINYVKSGGRTPALNQVFPIAIKNDFVRVAGGELIAQNSRLYLIGGQDFEGTYSAGSTGNYTNAIRSFQLKKNGPNWSLVNLNSLVDSVNLHRRDFNLAPYITANGSLDAILFGGVFTRNNQSYNNPVYIKGLWDGKPAISLDTFQQACNQYSCANIPMYITPGSGMMYALIGGISYKEYDPKTGKLVIGDKGVPMPFSNLVDFLVSDMKRSFELVQTPPRSLLPAYIGSNATFIALSKYASQGYNDIVDLGKISADSLAGVKIGYLYGGILSNGPTSGTTPEGNIKTYANPTLYSVYFSYSLNKMKDNQ